MTSAYDLLIIFFLILAIILATAALLLPSIKRRSRLSVYNSFRKEDGYCYLATNNVSVGRFPYAGHARENGVKGKYIKTGHRVWHLAKEGVDISSIPEFDVLGAFVDTYGYRIPGARPPTANWQEIVKSKIAKCQADVYATSRQVPTYNSFAGESKRAFEEVRNEMHVPHVRLPDISLSQVSTLVDEDQAHVAGRSRFGVLGAASALEAARILGTGQDVLGMEAERVANAMEMFRQGIETSVPPSDPSYHILTEMIGPLSYRPKIEAHRAAATIRRAAIAHANSVSVGARVGLIAPSTTEMHVFPNAVYWLYNDGATDTARAAKHCTTCARPRCMLLESALDDGRVIASNHASLAAETFLRFDVQVAILMNVEPNMHARDLLDFLVKAGVYNAYSLATMDWRVLVNRNVTDDLIGMTTTQEFNKIVSSFDDAGDYVQSLENCRMMFRPTYSSGHSMRRTVIFGQGASQYFEISISSSAIATRCVPQHHQYYMLRVPMPSGERAVILVERRGFDRVLATYRTQAVKDITTAKIVLRQSNVTYSISGTQVTPRIKLSASEFEGLSVWIVVYSDLQESIAERAQRQLSDHTTTSVIATSIWEGARNRLAATSGGQMALGSSSAVDAVLAAYRKDMRELTVDQLSTIAFEEIFGTKIDIKSAADTLMQKWSQLWSCMKEPLEVAKKIAAVAKETWETSFKLIDFFMVGALIGIDFGWATYGVLIDIVLLFARTTGRINLVSQMQQRQRYVQWHTSKGKLFWTRVQKAQDLGFQGGIIEVVNAYDQVFSIDYADEMQAIKEANLFKLEDEMDLEAQSQLPFSDYLTEIKLFLGRYNLRASVVTASITLLSAFQERYRKAPTSQLERMIHTIEKIKAQAAGQLAVDAMRFSLGGAPTLLDIPLRPLRASGEMQDVRGAFTENKALKFEPVGRIASDLRRLTVVDGKVDFSPIHTLMDQQHPGDVVNPARLKGPSYISPDDRGAKLQGAILEAVQVRNAKALFTDVQTVRNWYNAQIADPELIKPVKDIMTGALPLVETNISQWCAHIDGLAFGGKSAGIRKWIRARDLVIVPTIKLKEEWQAKLGLLDPLSNASVVTQHEALRHKYCTGYVIIDEAFTLDLEHLQMLANRHHLAKGVITVGDSRQISNVFSPTGMKLDPANAPACMVTPVSFAPWDVVALYLSQNSSSVACEHYFCGSGVGAGLQYAINGNDVLIPTLKDLAIQGTQNAKATVIGRGITSCRTTHECQGARSEYTIVHSSGSILQSDMRWLAMPEQRAHLGVTITRAAKGTVFVVDGVDNLKDFEWVDIGVAGELSTTCIFSGTAWDFIDPHTQDEVNVEYLREAAIVETSLEEPIRTDPITIGTIFNGSEALSAAEIRSNVEVTPGVKFRDENEAHSDAFDKYTLQPRDIPGADKIQALTRRSLDVKPTYADHCAAHAIVDLIFEEVIDKKKFFSHINNSRRATLNRRTRQQAIDGCYASEETRMSVTSFAFLKPEFAKKESQLIDGQACEIKAQGVVSASDMQQSVFADVCDSLTHAWARSMRPGKFSPVGLHEDDIALELSTYTQSYELDIEKQDSSHRAVHVLVAGRMMAFVADRLGLDVMAEELRSSRNVRMMNSPFSFLLNWALASGDPWTLIINKIMAVSVLVSLAEVKHLRFCQSGDDITLDRRPSWRHVKGIKAQTCANRGLKWKVEERSQRANGVTFISRGVLPGREVVYKALRTILKYAHRKRSRLQHVSIKADAMRIMAVSAHHGLQAYAESRCKVWGGDPVVVFDMWTRALAVARMPYDRLPFELKDDKEKPLTIKSKALGCFGFALAQCVGTNVQAVNAIASYPRTTPTSIAIAACDANKVPYIMIDEAWAKRSRERLQNLLADYDVKRGTVILYRDHAVAAVPTSIITHSSHGKREIRWKNVLNKSAEIVEF